MPITIKIKKAFFDREAVLKAADKLKVRALGKAGAYIRKVARQSIRNATKSKRVSEPGKPPLSHTGDLKRRILFGYDRAADSVVVGPMKFKAGDIPRTLEEGGRVSVNVMVGGKVTKRVPWRNQTGSGVKVYKSGGTKQTKSVPLRARPYMAPALDVALSKQIIPEAFRNNIISGAE